MQLRSEAYISMCQQDQRNQAVPITRLLPMSQSRMRQHYSNHGQTIASQLLYITSQMLRHVVSCKLCELQANIVCPNKHTAQTEAMFKGHLLESETYIGGKVEALESGVFRSDLPMRFKCKPEAYQVGISSPSNMMLLLLLLLWLLLCSDCIVSGLPKCLT